MSDLVSVVVPVYNSQDYLKKCMDSIVNQTYRNLDIILVDDGSTDNSGNICEEYAKKDNRIKVIHKKNGGNGDARNVGLENVSGDWIVWVDSDDVINTRHIEILLSVALENDADIVVGDYHTIEDRENPKDETIDSDIVKKAEIITEKHLYDDSFVKRHSMIFTVPWCKISKKTVFEDIKYPVKIRHVDTWTTWKTYEKADKVMFIPATLYYWRNNPNSLSRNKFDNSQYTMLDAYIEQLEYFCKRGKQRYTEIVFAELLDTFFWHYNMVSELKLSYSELEKYFEYMKNHIRYIKLTKSLGIYTWLRYRYLVYYKIPKLLK